MAEPRHEQNGCFYVVLGETKALVFIRAHHDPKPPVEELAGGREIVVVNSHFHSHYASGNISSGKNASFMLMSWFGGC